MTQPIDIPINKGRLQGAALGRTLFPEDEGPYFGYIEIFESGDIYRALSSGSGKYVEIGPRCTLPALAFIVEKHRASKSITIDITSSGLRQAVSRGIMSSNHTPVADATSPLELGFRTLLRHYDTLKSHFSHMYARFPYDEATLEMRLLVEDLLLERALYDGLGMEALCRQQVLCVTHLQDIHLRNISIGLDELESCFDQGMTPDAVSDQRLADLNYKYAELARSGDYSELRSLCEPVVRSRQVELHYSPELLLQVLENGHIDVFRYILDLIDRTKHTSMEILDPQYSDVTFDPLLVAIQLGQANAVQSFITEHMTFEGYVFDGKDHNERIFTPIVAAVYWQQAGILRQLLRSGPFYHTSIPQASALAVEIGSVDVLNALMEHHQPSTPGSFLSESYYPLVVAPVPISVTPQSLYSSMFTMQPVPSPSQKSVSGIANALSGLSTSFSAQPEGFLPQNSQDSLFVSPTQLEAPELTTPTIMIDSDYAFEPVFGDHSMDISYQLPEVPVLYLSYTRSYRVRQSLGRRFMERLEWRRNKVIEECRRHHNSMAYTAVSNYFTGPADIWKSGMDCFRQITRNKAPSSLVEVLRALLVTDALTCQIEQRDAELDSEFMKDLGRWRTLLLGSEQDMFDEIVGAVWSVESIPAVVVPENDADELYRFQELIQHLICLDCNKSFVSTSCGSRLRTIQQQMRGRRRKPNLVDRAIRSPSGSFQSIGSVLGRLTHDTDSFYEDELDIADFIDLRALGGEPVDPKPVVLDPDPPAPEAWKDVKPVVVLLFASVAFSVALTVVSAVQDDPEELRAVELPTASPGYGRSRAVVTEFLSFKSEDSSYDSGIDVRTPLSDSSVWIREMKSASQKQGTLESLNPLGSAVGSLDRLGVPGSMSSPSGSSFISTDFSSDTARSRERRVKCQSCSKTFSSVSNRNKHSREGCVFRAKKGYKCRNGNCSRVLTTKWYRNTHESERCRNRPI